MPDGAGLHHQGSASFTSHQVWLIEVLLWLSLPAESHLADATVSGTNHSHNTVTSISLGRHPVLISIQVLFPSL